MRYSKDIAYLLFWELWECLIILIKIIVLVYRKLLCLSACKKSTSPVTSFLRYCRDIVNLLFWALWACIATHTQNDTINCRKNSSLFASKKSTSFPIFFWIYSKYMQTSYFDYFGHGWSRSLKIIKSACRKLWCLFNYAKNKLHHSFLPWDITF